MRIMATKYMTNSAANNPSKIPLRKAASAGESAENKPKKKIDEIKEEIQRLSSKKNPSKADRLKLEALRKKLIELQQNESKEKLNGMSASVSDGETESPDESAEVQAAAPSEAPEVKVSDPNLGETVDVTI